MFNISTKPRVTRPVPLFVEVDGTKEDHSFSATFQIIDVDKTTPERLNDDAGQIAFLREVIVGLGDVVDKDKQPIPYGEPLLAAVLNRFDARGALIKVYFNATQEAAQGN